MYGTEIEEIPQQKYLVCKEDLFILQESDVHIRMVGNCVWKAVDHNEGHEDGSAG